MALWLPVDLEDGPLCFCGFQSQNFQDENSALEVELNSHILLGSRVPGGGWRVISFLSTHCFNLL